MAKNKNYKSNHLKNHNIGIGDNSPENINAFVYALTKGKLNKEDIEAFLASPNVAMEQIGKALLEAIEGHKEVSLKVQDSLQQIISAINQISQNEHHSPKEREMFAKYLYKIAEILEKTNRENNKHNEKIMGMLLTAFLILTGIIIQVLTGGKIKPPTKA